MERKIRYRYLGRRSDSGEGTTINMSSSGVLFAADRELTPGRLMELSISWPVQLNAKCALKMLAWGRIVRFHDGRGAIKIDRYEYRTASAQ